MEVFHGAFNNSFLENFATCIRVHSVEGKTMFQFYWNEDTALLQNGIWFWYSGYVSLVI